MHHAGVPRQKLPGLDIPRHVAGDRQHEVSVHVVAGRAKLEQFGLKHEIGLAELPAAVRFGSGGSKFAITFDRTVVDPFLDQRDLLVGEPALVGKLTIARLRFPGRHLALQDCLLDGLCPRTGVLITTGG